MLSVYFPTSWDDDSEIETMYELLQLILNNIHCSGARIVIGGDFNAYVGSLQWSDEQDVVGEWGSGLRNARGAALISWILMNGLRIASRQSPTNNVDDSWTCQGTMDGARVQLDYILTDARACVDTIWHDQLIPIGLDHRCVHCLLRWRGVRPSSGNRRLNLKNWMPILDMDGGPSLFQNSLRDMLDGNSTISCEVLEHCLLESGKQQGVYGAKTFSFKPSAMLRNLRNSRRQSVDAVRRKELSFHIQKLHRQELRTWKSTKLSACLCNLSSWKMLRGMLRTPGHEIADQPHVDDFA